MKKKKDPAKFTRKSLLFSSSVQKDSKKFFITTTGFLCAKYILINEKIYQAIGVINLNEINGWEKIKKFSRWVNLSFQSQIDNSQTQHFANNFITKNASDILDFGMKLIDDKNKEIELVDGEKNPYRKVFDWTFRMNRINRTKQKSREEHMEDVLIELEKDLSNFQITIQKKDKIIQEYIRLLKLTKQEYQKLFQ